MAAGNWIVYDIFKVNFGNKMMDMDADTFKCMLLTDNYTPSLTADEVYTDISADEVSSTNTGYTIGGQTISGLSWTEDGSTTTWDASGNIAQWTAGSANLTARYASIYDDTVSSPVADPLVCYSLLDTTPADVTATNGNTFTITPHASGIFTLSGATS
jgi:hypothetical protein